MQLPVPHRFNPNSGTMQAKRVLSCLAIVLLHTCATVHGVERAESFLSGSCMSPKQRCLLPVECATGPRARLRMESCLTADGLEGFCCNPSERRKRSLPYELSEEVYSNAVDEGHRVYSRKLAQFARNRAGEMMTGQVGVDSLVRRFHPSPSVAEATAAAQEFGAYEDVFVARSVADALNLTEAESLELGFVTPKRHSKRCVTPKPCNPHARYRSFDGTCNNPVQSRSSWGAAGHPFERLLPPAYEDGVWAPRLHSVVSGRPLASPRTISVAVFPDQDRPDRRFNLLLMQFGQFMAHDFTRSASIRMGGEEIQCCNPEFSGPLHPDQAHFACLPIDVSPNDPFFAKFGIRCLNFVRLALARDGKCLLGYGKQLNRITHFIDGSHVYGSDEATAASLRTFVGGRLKNTFPSGEELLPFASDRSACEPWAKACFRSGDDRTNQVISLTEVHTLFLREHNRVAARLEALNRHWDDETLYQEARRIVVAELQKIFYNEYLPAVLGHQKAQRYGLLDGLQGYTNFYNADVRPLVFNELSGAAFRFGHSTVDGAFLIQHRHRRSELVPLHKVFLDPSRMLERSFFDDFLFSLMDQPQQQVDDAVTFELSRMLFAGRLPFGSDLVALNIQRGRDHALRPYNDYREWAGLSRVTSFEQFGPAAAALASVYASPDDVDLWVGGILEPPSQDGALFGETFAAVIGEQFARLKFGDRYYYTNGPRHNPGFFSGEQLAELASLSFASVICANLDHPQGFSVAWNVFQQPSEHNPPVPCSTMSPFDLTAWSDH